MGESERALRGVDKYIEIKYFLAGVTEGINTIFRQTELNLSWASEKYIKFIDDIYFTRKISWRRLTDTNI